MGGCKTSLLYENQHSWLFSTLFFPSTKPSMKLPPTFTKSDKRINVVIETPKGSRNKFVYDPENDYFKLKKTLPFGTVFPFDFGFVPGTKGEDEQPIDVVLLMDFPTFPGCVVECRCLGVVLAEQKEKLKTIRNDRIICVPE